MEIGNSEGQREIEREPQLSFSLGLGMVFAAKLLSWSTSRPRWAREPQRGSGRSAANGAGRLWFSGVIFTIDTKTGFTNAVLINAAYGLGENVVKGTVLGYEL